MQEKKLNISDKEKLDYINQLLETDDEFKISK